MQIADYETRRDVGGWDTLHDPELAMRARAAGIWPDLTVADLARKRLSEDPHRILVVDGASRLSVQDLVDQAGRLAGAFADRGLAPGDVISFQLPNWWEASVINLAAAMTGVVVNPIVPLNREGEVSHMLAIARSRMMFIPRNFRGHDYAGMMRSVCAQLDAPPEVVLVRSLDLKATDGFTQFDSLVGGSPLAAPVAVDPDAVKLMMFTSGTTGRPKAVLHSHNTLHSDGLRMRAGMGLTPDEIVFCPSPVTHVSGYLWNLNMPWLTGYRSVSIDTWSAEPGFAALRDDRCTVMVGATPFLQDLVNRIEAVGETLDALRHYICGGAAVPPALIYRAARCLPNAIPWRTFGATETTTLTVGPSSRADIRLGAETDGRIHDVDVRVVDLSTGDPVPAGTEGELVVRGAGLMLGYADPKDTLRAFDRDGYFRMGDIVRIVETDHIVCTGRTKDLIIRSGENISAKEIEDVLAGSPRIEEAAVVSMPSARTGEAICAFIVAKQGEVVDLAHVADLIRKAGLARQKTPEHVECVDELPKTAAGKVRKDVLRERASRIAAS